MNGEGPPLCRFVNRRSLCVGALACQLAWRGMYGRP
jgi:hypothetical protein